MWSFFNINYFPLFPELLQFILELQKWTLSPNTRDDTKQLNNILAGDMRKHNKHWITIHIPQWGNTLGQDKL